MLAVTNKRRTVGVLAAAAFVVVIPNVVAGPVTRSMMAGSFLDTGQKQLLQRNSGTDGVN